MDTSVELSVLRFQLLASSGLPSVLAVRGQLADHLLVVESGTVLAVHETADGRRLRWGEFTGPCAVDKTAVLDGGGHTATWAAATRVEYRRVPSAALLALIDDVPAVRRHVLAHLARQVRDRQADLARIAFGDGVSRVVGWLLDRAGRTAIGADQGGTRIVLLGAQQGLAEAIGMTRVSVNRVLRRLAQDGLIRIEPGVVVLLAPELLAARARQRLGT